ncbi:MAG: hypothetical protein HYT90_00245 [Candidatus Omnitrophica bacterium]|nr:hypothetical protein [Candidatus Omnitrophota bacterium]
MTRAAGHAARRPPHPIAMPDEPVRRSLMKRQKKQKPRRRRGPPLKHPRQLQP